MKVITLAVSAAIFACTTSALPQGTGRLLDRLLNGNNRKGVDDNAGSVNSEPAQANSQTAGNGATGAATQGQATSNANGQAQLSTATDGSTIVDMTANINNLPIRFKVSGPADQFLSSTTVPGAAATSANGTMGLNVLLHGDGGQSFFDFPNQAVQQNLMGVVALAPNEDLFWGGGSGLDRTDGVEHAQAVNDLVQQVLPQVVSFDSSNVFFTGVSGGSLLLSGFFIPAHMTNFQTGVELNCGALTPQVDFVDAAATIPNTRIHFQSTQQELAELQPELPKAITAFEQMASQAGLNDTEINALMTVDNTPNGGHCEFDGQDFVSGVQLMASNYAAVMQGGDGNVNGIGVVTNGIVGNENLQFSGAS